MSALPLASARPDGVYVSVLAPDDPGKLRAPSFVPDASAEAFLRALVEKPAETVARLIGASVEEWQAEEARLVRELAQAPNDAARKAVKAQIPGLVPARFAGLERNSAACLGRQIIGHDFDAVEAETFEAACEKVRAQLPDRFLAIHTTATERNPDGTWRLRPFEVLDREATLEDWNTRVQPHMRSVREHDANALDFVRLLYMPLRTAGYRWHVYDGPRTRLDALAAAPTSTPPPTGPRPAGRSVRASSRHAAVAMLAAAWPAKGRHGAQLALAGGLHRNGWAEADALEILCDVCRLAGDEDRAKRTATVRDTWARAGRGEQIAGWGALGEHVTPTIAQHACELLHPDVDVMAEIVERDLGGIANDTATSTSPPPAKMRLSAAERALRVGGDGTRLLTGFPTLDAATRGGILLRKVVAIGGAPGAGKTATAVQLAHRWLTEDVVVGFFCADEDADALLIRFGQLAGLSRDRLEAGDSAERAKLAGWCEGVSFLLVDGDEDETVEDVSAELAGLAAGRPSALFVDSIQTARTKEQAPKGADMRARINVVMRVLKHAAKAHGHVVVATSEISKAAYRNQDQAENVNMLSAFKESGDIEYGVGVALVLTNRPGTSELVDGHTVKNRLGPTRPKLLLRLDHRRAAVAETADASAGDPLYMEKEEVRAVVAEAAGRPLTLSAVYHRTGGRKQIVFQAIREMLSAKELIEDDRGGVRFPLPGDPGYGERR